MNISLLNDAFMEKSELEVVRLLTCNFELGAFSLAEPYMPKDVAATLRSAIKFRTHLSMEPTTLGQFMEKIHGLLRSSQAEYTGSVTKLAGYSGELLTKAKTFLGTPEELVSFNEYAYVIKLYPWWIRPVNKVFEPYIDQYAEKQAFFCLPTFDLEDLKSKPDVISVTEESITLKGKIKLPVIRVE